MTLFRSSVSAAVGNPTSNATPDTATAESDPTKNADGKDGGPFPGDSDSAAAAQPNSVPSNFTLPSRCFNANRFASASPQQSAFGLGHSLEMTVVPRRADPHSDYVGAFLRQGGEPAYLKLAKLDGLAELPLDEKLARIDEANAAFKFEYQKQNGDNGDEDSAKYVKFHPHRSELVTDVDVDDSGTSVGVQEYIHARRMLEGAGDLQRIARSVPYSDIHLKIKNHLERNSIPLPNVVIVNLDTSVTRIFGQIIQDAMGITEIYSLEKNNDGSIDEGRFKALGIAPDKCILFIDPIIDTNNDFTIGSLNVLLNDADAPSNNWAVIGNIRDDDSDIEPEIFEKNLIPIEWGFDPDAARRSEEDLRGLRNSGQIAQEIRDVFASVARGSILEIPPDVDERRAQYIETTILKTGLTSYLTERLQKIRDTLNSDLEAEFARLARQWIEDTLIEFLASWNANQLLTEDQLGILFSKEQTPIHFHLVVVLDNPSLQHLSEFLREPEGRQGLRELNYSLTILSDSLLKEIVDQVMATFPAVSRPEINIASLRGEYGNDFEGAKELPPPGRRHLARLINAFIENSDANPLEAKTTILRSSISKILKEIKESYARPTGNPLITFLGQMIDLELISDSTATAVLQKFPELLDAAAIPLASFFFLKNVYGLQDQDLKSLMHHLLLQDPKFTDWLNYGFSRAALMDFNPNRIVKPAGNLQIDLNWFNISELLNELYREKLKLDTENSEDHLKIVQDPNLQSLAAGFLSQQGQKLPDEEVAATYSNADVRGCLSVAFQFLEDWKKLAPLAGQHSEILARSLHALREIQLAKYPKALELSRERLRPLFDTTFYTALVRPDLNLDLIRVTAQQLFLLSLNPNRLEEVCKQISIEANNLFIECGISELEIAAREVKRNKKVGHDLYGELGTGIKEEYMDALRRGTAPLPWPELKHHFELILGSIDKREAYNYPQSAQAQIMLSVAMDMAPLYAHVPSEDGKTLISKTCALALHILTEMPQPIFAQYADRARAFILALSEWPEEGHAKLKDNPEEFAAKFLIRAIGTKEQKFASWQEANDYLQKNLPGIWIKIEVTPGQLPPVDHRHLRELRARIWNKRSTPLGIFAAPDLEKRAAPERISDFLAAAPKQPVTSAPNEEHSQKLTAPTNVEYPRDLTATTSEEIFNWLHRHGTLDLETVRAFQISQPIVNAAKRAGQVEEILNKLQTHWGKILDHFPRPNLRSEPQNVEPRVRAMLMFANEIRSTYSFLEIPFSADDRFLSEAYSKITRFTLWGGHPRNWDQARTQASEQINWGKKFTFALTYASELDEKFAQERKKHWNVDAPMPSARALAMFLTREDSDMTALQSAIADYINPMPPGTANAEKLAQILQNFMKHYDPMNEENKAQAHPGLIALIGHILAETQAVGKESYLDDIKNDKLKLRAYRRRLLIDDIRSHIKATEWLTKDGRFIGGQFWRAVQNHIRDNHPSVPQTEKEGNFAKAIFNAKIGENPLN